MGRLLKLILFFLSFERAEKLPLYINYLYMKKKNIKIFWPLHLIIPDT